ERKNLISNSIKKDNYDGENQYKVIGFGIDKITEKPKSKKLEKSPKKEEAKKKEVVISAGKKGSWTKELDDPKPNTIYKVTCKHGSDTIVYTYETDHLKRTVRVKGKLKLSPLTAKTREKTHRSGHKQQKYGPKVAKHEGKTEQYDGGHLIATLFMGPAEKINMIPQLRVKNQSRKKDGQWYKMEESWADFIRDGESVEVDIKIAYEKSANTPKTIRGSYTVSNDDPISFRCKN
ncbi:DNA/RNA non-specific endonuclease, partial [Parendozoicomonas haliclonae]